VAVPFKTIQPEVERIRNYVLGDLSRLVRLKKGGNYLAVALINCACDAFSNLLEYCRRLKQRFSLPIEYEQIVLEGV
jgi:hypothetical protein